MEHSRKNLGEVESYKILFICYPLEEQSLKTKPEKKVIHFENPLVKGLKKNSVFWEEFKQSKENLLQFKKTHFFIA